MEYAVPKTPNQNLNSFLSDLQSLRDKAAQSSDEVVKSLDEALSRAFEEIYKNIIRQMQKNNKSKSEICEFLGIDEPLYDKLCEQIMADDKINRVYTLDEIKERVRPVAEKYNLPAVWVFGSYARGEATGKSDVDILFDSENSTIEGKGLFAMGGLQVDLEDALNKEVDMVRLSVLEKSETRKDSPYFVAETEKDRVRIYG
jgi:predicted nucleotidyltransferase